MSAVETIGLQRSFVYVSGRKVAAAFDRRGTASDGREVAFRGIDPFEFNEAGQIPCLRSFWTYPRS